MKLRTATLCIFALLMSSTTLYSYGPATHIGEAVRYIEMLEDQPLTGPKGDIELLSDPEILPYFKLGATFPDIGRMLPGFCRDPHDEPFGYYLFERGVDESGQAPWKQAFALGYLMHICGDISAQLFVTQRFAVLGEWGELSVFAGVMDDHPGGENEMLAEAWLEIEFADLSQYLRLLIFFLQGTRLDEVLDFYNTSFADFCVGTASSNVDIARQRLIVIEKMTDWIDFAERKNGDLWHDLLAAWRAGIGLDGQSLTPDRQSGLINERELTRLLEGPTFSDPEFWDMYPDQYKELGPTILRAFEPGENWYDVWPTWSAQTMSAASIGSLAHFLPDLFHPDADIIVWDVAWTDGEGAPLSEVDAQSLPAQICCEVEIYTTSEVARTVSARIRRHMVGVDPGADPILGSESVSFEHDPYAYSTTDLATVQACVDPGGMTDDTWGYVMDLVTGSYPDKAFFTTNFEAFYAIGEIDILGLTSYQTIYDTYDKWPRSIRLTGQEFPLGHYVLRGKVVDAATGYNVPFARILINETDSLQSNANGYFEIGGLAEGPTTITPTLASYHVPPIAGYVFEGAAGDNLYVEAAMEPRPEVIAPGAYYPNNTMLPVQWEAGELAGSPYNFSAAIGTDVMGDDVAAWRGVGKNFQATIDFDSPVADGAMVYASVRVSDGETDFPIGFSDRVVMDGSPPAEPEISTNPSRITHSGDTVEIALTSEDEHSGIAGYEIAVGYGDEPIMLIDWMAVSSADELLISEIPEDVGMIAVFARAINGAGIYSTISAISMPVAPPPGDDDAQSDDDNGVGDDDDSGSPDSGDDDDDDNGGCCG
jgi:hypothetical protein